jgi:hypothetical protein
MAGLSGGHRGQVKWAGNESCLHLRAELRGGCGALSEELPEGSKRSPAGPCQPLPSTLPRLLKRCLGEGTGGAPGQSHISQRRGPCLKMQTPRASHHGNITPTPAQESNLTELPGFSAMASVPGDTEDRSQGTEARVLHEVTGGLVWGRGRICRDQGEQGRVGGGWGAGERAQGGREGLLAHRGTRQLIAYERISGSTMSPHHPSRWSLRPSRSS